MVLKRLIGCSLLAVVLCAQEKPSTENPAFQWEPVLKAARAYCQRLGIAALDFVCQEEVVEIVRSGRDDLERGARAGRAVLGISPRSMPSRDRITAGPRTW